jgi:hypothetical protein
MDVGRRNSGRVLSESGPCHACLCSDRRSSQCKSRASWYASPLSGSLLCTVFRLTGTVELGVQVPGYNTMGMMGQQHPQAYITAQGSRLAHSDPTSPMAVDHTSYSSVPSLPLIVILLFAVIIEYQCVLTLYDCCRKWIMLPMKCNMIQ